MNKHDIRKTVRNRYGRIARQAGSTGCCGTTGQKGVGCCGPVTADKVSRKIGYSKKDIDSVPDGANLGLGCGNPVALASLKIGEVVLDLGSGAGFDCFLASKRIGENGRVIGVDMTPDMLEKARGNARKGGYKNVEFRLGEIENLPVPDSSVDVIISNCVINLSPDKPRVFNEAFRVLKPGGRLMVSDIVLTRELPDAVAKSIEAYVGCIAGAEIKGRYLSAIEKAGFEKTQVAQESVFPIDSVINDPVARDLMIELKMTPEALRKLAGTILSVKVSAFKPRLT
jgi:ubiquinone/menaquinone biosynthesis C-methylase UbiE